MQLRVFSFLIDDNQQTDPPALCSWKRTTRSALFYVRTYPRKGCDCGVKNRGWGWKSGQKIPHQGKKRPIRAICAKSGQKCSRIGPKKIHNAKLARDHICSRWTENAETQDRGAKTFNNSQRQQRGRREKPQGQRANEENGGDRANLAKGLPAELTKQLQHFESGGSGSEDESLLGFEYVGVATEVSSPTESNSKAELDSSGCSVS